MNSNINVKATFVDKFGDERIIHGTRHGLKVKRKGSTLAHTLMPVLGKFIGQRIKEERIKRGLTLEELCIKAGLSSSTPKERMWEIENSIRQQGIRFATLYCIAMALDIEVAQFLPTNQQLSELASVGKVTKQVVSIK